MSGVQGLSGLEQGLLNTAVKLPGFLECTKFLDQSVCSLEKNSSLSDKVYLPTSRHYSHTCSDYTQVLHLEVFDNFHWQLGRHFSYKINNQVCQ